MEILEKRQDDVPSNGLRFACSRCSICCRFESGYVWLSRKDLYDLKRGLELSAEQTILRYCRIVDIGGFRQLSLEEQPNKDCVFWQNGACSVYEFRPLQCRTYPFWSHQVDDTANWEEASNHCPGIGIGRIHPQAEIAEQIEKRRLEPPLNADTLSI
jgi:uncharacterized protein